MLEDRKAWTRPQITYPARLTQKSGQALLKGRDSIGPEVPLNSPRRNAENERIFAISALFRGYLPVCKSLNYERHEWGTLIIVSSLSLPPPFASLRALRVFGLLFSREFIPERCSGLSSLGLFEASRRN